MSVDLIHTLKTKFQNTNKTIRDLKHCSYSYFKIYIFNYLHLKNIFDIKAFLIYSAQCIYRYVFSLLKKQSLQRTEHQNQSSFFPFLFSY